MSVKVSQTN